MIANEYDKQPGEIELREEIHKLKKRNIIYRIYYCHD